jgi:hypothetical protein
MAVLVGAPWACGDRFGPPASDVASGASDASTVASDVAVALLRAPPALRGSYEVTDNFLGGQEGVTVVGDCDGDGRVDFLNRATLFVQNAGGGFDPVALEGMSGRKGGALVDLDGDGALDLVLVGAGVEWRRGDGRCRFGAPQGIAADVEGEAAQVLVQDVDLDGLADLTVARQERRDLAFQFFVARGDGRFEDRTSPPTPMAMHQDVPYRTFGTFYDDVDGDGALDLFAAVDIDLGWFSWGVPGDAPRFLPDPAITRDLSQSSPMSVSPIDYDRDGSMDYFVSGSFDHSRLYRYRGGRQLEDVAARAGVGSVAMTTDDLWGSLSFDADLDGYPDLLALVVPDDHQGGGWSRLLINRHDGTFGLAAPSVLHQNLQAIGMVCADFWAEGRPSCLARDIGPRGLVLLRNRIEPQGRWVGLRLRGTVSSPDASGARVSLDGARPPLVVMAGGQSPTLGEHDRGVLLAIGDASEAAVTVTWPSGIRQRVAGLRAGAYATVTEPRALEVRARVAPADGRALVEVVVDPRAAGASLATLGCSGACAWQGEASTDAEGRLHRTLRAPATPGAARVEASLDGSALRVRPRVRFE